MPRSQVAIPVPVAMLLNHGVTVAEDASWSWDHDLEAPKRVTVMSERAWWW